MGLLTNVKEFKDHVSLRGVLLTILGVVVAGLAIATLRYQPSVPDDGYVSPATTTTVVPWATAPPTEVPSVRDAPPAAPPPPPVEVPTSTPPPPEVTPTFTEPPSPTQAPAATQAPVVASPDGSGEPANTETTAASTASPTSSAPPPTTATRRNTNPTLLPNGGRRFGTVQ